jgi:hypothetical protein
MVEKYLGQKVKDVITLSTIDNYPLFICLSFNKGQVEVVDTITSRDDTLVEY